MADKTAQMVGKLVMVDADKGIFRVAVMEYQTDITFPLALFGSVPIPAGVKITIQIGEYDGISTQIR